MGNRISAPLPSETYYIVASINSNTDSIFKELARNISIPGERFISFCEPIVTYWNTRLRPRIRELTRLFPVLSELGIYNEVQSLSRHGVPCILGYVDNTGLKHISIIMLTPRYK